MQCGEVDAILEEEDDGRIRVVKIIKDKYGDYTKWVNVKIVNVFVIVL